MNWIWSNVRVCCQSLYAVTLRLFHLISVGLSDTLPVIGVTSSNNTMVISKQLKWKCLPFSRTRKEKDLVVQEPNVNKNAQKGIFLFSFQFRFFHASVYSI